MRMEHWLFEVPLRFRSLFRRQRVEQDLDEELQYHLERKAEESIAQGMTREQAQHAALRAMDGLTQRKEECRDMRKVNLIEEAVEKQAVFHIEGSKPNKGSPAILEQGYLLGGLLQDAAHEVFQRSVGDSGAKVGPVVLSEKRG